MSDCRCSFERLVRPIRRHVRSVRRLELSTGCESHSAATMSFDEALERADTTRFVVAAERRSSAPWLRHMAAHRESAAQRGTQWRRQAPVNRRVDPLPPEPETVQSSSDDDAVRLAAGYCEVLPRCVCPVINIACIVREIGSIKRSSVALSVRLSVPSIYCSKGGQQVCC